MNNILLGFAVCLVTFGSALSQEQQKPPLEPKTCVVDKMVFAKAVENREPQDVATEFNVSVDSVFCWTRITCPSVPTSISHIWYLNGTRSFEIPLKIDYPTTRTWSEKHIAPGQWKVEVMDINGKILETKGFTVKQ